MEENIDSIITDFKNWANEGEISKRTTNNYVTWLKNLQNYNISHFNNVEKFYCNGDYLYALSYCELLHKEWEKYKNISKKDWNNRRSAVRLLLRFLRSKKISCTTGDGLDISRRKINKSDLHKIDGIEVLVSELGINKFVKMAVEQSYFFDPDIVRKRHRDLNKMIYDYIPVPVRKSKTGNRHHQIDGIWQDVESGIPIKLDEQGNREVRQIIGKYTGYTVCGGKGSVFQNYIISHIWGRAFDPRYFTSLWNIVIIPAWANGLMDKINPEKESYASILQAVIQQICVNLYFSSKESINLNDIKDQISKPVVYNLDDVIFGEYKINVIGEVKDSNKLVAPISQKIIYLKKRK